MQEWLLGWPLVRGYLIGTGEKGQYSGFQEAEQMCLGWVGLDGFPRAKIQYEKVQEGIQNKENIC